MNCPICKGGTDELLIKVGCNNCKSKGFVDDPFMETISYRCVNLADPNPDSIVITDIAWHLSQIIRWTGACKFQYSVAQHSIWACYLAPEELKLEALMHDAHEAYIGDISRPMKILLGYQRIKEIEKKFDTIIEQKYGVRFGSQRVKEIDDLLLHTEARNLGPGGTSRWETHTTPSVFEPRQMMLDLTPEVIALERYDGSVPSHRSIQLTNREAFTHFLRLFNKYKKV